MSRIVMREATAIRNGGSLRPTFKRSLKRAMQTLTLRRDVVIVGGSGGRWSPYAYASNFMRLRKTRSLLAVWRVDNRLNQPSKGLQGMGLFLAVAVPVVDAFD